MKILRIRTLEKGWTDKDHVMLHAAFQLLVDFVEQEKPEKIVDWNATPEYKHAWKEIRTLYKWWRRTRPGRQSPLDERSLKKPPRRWKKVPGSDSRQLSDYDRKKYAAYDSALKKHWQLEEKWDEEDQRNLYRLIDIRPFLWT
ncbi:MAG TPA: hypothetical protein VLM91_08590 [Candidatus Methylomirabilis sp.]|nr:hypothetical protein [Candidatus Methylomirabilis sp.]